MEERNFCWPFWPTLGASFCPYLKYTIEWKIKSSSLQQISLSPFTFRYFFLRRNFPSAGFFLRRFPPNHTRCTPTRRDLIPSQADCQCAWWRETPASLGAQTVIWRRTPTDPPSTRLFLLPLARQRAITLAPVG